MASELASACAVALLPCLELIQTPLLTRSLHLSQTPKLGGHMTAYFPDRL